MSRLSLRLGRMNRRSLGMGSVLSRNACLILVVRGAVLIVSLLRNKLGLLPVVRFCGSAFWDLGG